MLLSRLNKKEFFFIFLVILLCVPTILPLLRGGFFESDDGEWMVIRFSAFYQAFVDGQFPVRFLGRLNHDYGYPVANFLYPGFMYMGVPIKVLGFGFVDTIKIILGVSIVTSGIFTYLWLNRLFSKVSSLFGSLLYVYAPYHLYDIYQRGSVGEVLALAVVPFVLWQIERKSVLFLSLGIAMIILSHNTLALLFLPVIFLYAFIRKTMSVSYLSLSVFTGVLLSTFFWLPAVHDLQYTKFFQTKISDWSVYFVGYELIGLVTIVIVVLSTIILANEKKHQMNLPIFFFVLAIFSIFFSISVSKVIWEVLPVSFIQFPFRFLSITILSASFLGAYLLSKQAKRTLHIAAGALLLLTFYSSVHFIKPKVFFDKGEGFYATNMDTTTVKNEYMPRWVKAAPVQRFDEPVEIRGSGRIENMLINANSIEFQVVMETDGIVRINEIYFPGRIILVNGQETAPSYANEEGLMDMHVGKGTYSIKSLLRETPVRLFSDGLSILGVGVFAFLARKKI